MDVPDFDIADLGDLWWSPSDVEIASFSVELRREMPRGHPLAKEKMKPVAVKKFLDDWILWLPDRGVWAKVHLTHQRETDPRWPSATFASTWRELVAEVS